MEELFKKLVLYYRNNPDAVVCYKVSQGRFIRQRRKGLYLNEKVLMDQFRQYRFVSPDKCALFLRKKLSAMCFPTVPYCKNERYDKKYRSTHDCYTFLNAGEEFVVFFSKRLRKKLYHYNLTDSFFYRIRHRGDVFYLDYDVMNRFLVYWYLYLNCALNGRNRKLFRKACVGVYKIMDKSIN